MTNISLVSRRRLAAATLLALWYIGGRTCLGGECCPQDEFWIISTRHIDEIPCQALPSQVRVCHREGNCWRRSSLDAFLAGHDPATVTVFYVHGNRYTAEEALERGLLIHRFLRQGANDDAPIRFVTWSWPSDPVPGLLYDVRTKAERTDVEGLYLGTVLSRLPPDALVSLVGFSFGTRVISGSLHLLAGGQLERRSLPPEHVMPRLPLRALLLAPAFQNTWLLPGNFHELALTQVERMLVLYNSADPVLRRYRLISSTANAQALGYTGLVGLERLGPLARRVEQWDLRSEVGHSHDELRYLDSSYFAMGREYVLWRTRR
jgi:hypothetical protein